jgi:hypothetical protein
MRMSFETQQKIQDATADAEASFFIEQKLVSPAFTDEYTGLPLPILPVDNYGSTFDDQHHAFFSEDQSAFANESGRVLRHSRLQYGPRKLHSRYHGFFDGVAVPKDEVQRFGMAVLACAGYIPENAVDVRGSAPIIVTLTPEERLYLQSGDVIYTERRMSSLTGRDMNNLNRGVYFMKHAMAQSFDHLKKNQLEEFVTTTDALRRLELGMFIVNQAFLRAVEPIEDLYRVAYKHGHIHPQERRHPVGIVEKVVAGYQSDYFDEITRRIVAAA